MIGLIALPLFLACTDDGGDINQPRPEPRLEITPSNTAIDVGETIRLRAKLWNAEGEVIDADHPVDWASSKPEVLLVSDYGYVTGIAPGAAIITAEGAALSDWTRVTVRQVPVVDRPPGEGEEYEPEDDRERER
jgi:hypothetical protein